MSCLAFLPYPISHVLLHFVSLSSSPSHPEVGPARWGCACEAQLCPWHASAQHPTACERLTRSGMCSMWPRCSCHPLHFLMRFVPLLIKVMGLRYGGGKVMDGRGKESYPWPSWAGLNAPACSVWELGMGKGRCCVWRWIYSISEEDFLEWKLEFLPKTPLQLFFGHCPCLGSRKMNFLLPNSVLMCRNTSADIFIVKMLSNLWDTLCLSLACLKRLFFFSKFPVWPKYSREEERVNNNISRTETFPTNTKAMR